jgi:hypothetical protein
MINPMQFPLLVFAVSFLLLWASARVGCRFRGVLGAIHEDFTVILTATLTLLGLILGFAFSMAVTRYDQRKLYEEEEANAIGTEYVRTQLVPTPDGDNVRKLLREYLDQRILFYETRSGERLRQIDTTTAQLQTGLWNAVKVPSLAQQTPITALLVSGMNDVLNSQGYTRFAWGNRIPGAAWALMGIIAICGNTMVGLYLRGILPRSSLLMVLPAVVAVSFFLIADIDSPRGGLIHVKPENLINVAQALRS